MRREPIIISPETYKKAIVMLKHKFKERQLENATEAIIQFYYLEFLEKYPEYKNAKLDFEGNIVKEKISEEKK